MAYNEAIEDEERFLTKTQIRREIEKHGYYEQGMEHELDAIWQEIGNRDLYSPRDVLLALGY